MPSSEFVTLNRVLLSHHPAVADPKAGDVHMGRDGSGAPLATARPLFHPL
jgi:hypothetical protein